MIAQKKRTLNDNSLAGIVQSPLSAGLRHPAEPAHGPVPDHVGATGSGIEAAAWECPMR